MTEELQFASMLVGASLAFTVAGGLMWVSEASQEAFERRRRIARARVRSWVRPQAEGKALREGSLVALAIETAAVQTTGVTECECAEGATTGEERVTEQRRHVERGPLAVATLAQPLGQSPVAKQHALPPYLEPKGVRFLGGPHRLPDGNHGDNFFSHPEAA